MNAIDIISATVAVLCLILAVRYARNGRYARAVLDLALAASIAWRLLGGDVHPLVTAALMFTVAGTFGYELAERRGSGE
jgi:hypothetical protein